MADFYDNFYDNLDPTEDGEEEGTGYLRFSGRDSIIIAVDCCEEMFKVTEDDDETCPFTRICESTKNMLRNKIICSENDLQGIIFFGTQETKNPSDFKHVYITHDLDSPSAARIEDLQTLQDSSEDDVKEKYGQCKDYQVSELLWCASSVFSRSPSTLSSKTLIIFTWEDDPHHGDRNAHLRARTKAKDLMEQGIVIQVLSFNKSFKYNKFYKDIVSDTDDVSLIQNPIDSITNLCELLLRKCTKQRSTGSVSFILCEGVEMSIGVYTAAIRAKKGQNIYLDTKTNQEVQSKLNFVEKDTADIMLVGDIKMSQKWGNRDIIFDNEEVTEMRKFGAGMKLLGFKPKEKAIKLWNHVKASQFIYPDEKTVKGSSTLFSALLTKCIEKKTVPICSLAARSNSAPRCVALLPQAEEIDESGEQVQSPGFYVIHLPFSEDMRNIEVKETDEPSKESVETAESLVRKLRFTYYPSNFDNPALQKHYRNLEAMALEKDEPETIDDFTLPNNEKINKKAGDLISQFKEQVYPEGYNPLAKNAPKKAAVKRKRDDTNGNSKDMRTDDIKQLVQSGKLAKLTVPVLKEFCKNNAISATGKKKDLIDAIEEHFSS